MQRYIFAGSITILICLFFWQYLFTGERLYGGDFDYYAQLYEAFRISVLKFHQLPFWNPWMSGGVPLFANPQLGPFSIQAFLVLALGTVYGLKLTYVLYAIAGFWGMYLLCRRVFSTTAIRSTLIGFLWICNGFFAGHSISHFTFASFFLLPWLFLVLAYWRRKWTWVYLAIFEVLIVFSALHYPLLVMNFSLFVFAATIGLARYLTKRLHFNDVKQFVWFLTKAALLTLLIAGYRIYHAVSYTQNNPRPEALFYETTPGVDTLVSALFLPVQSLLAVPNNLQWSWSEYSMYVGFGATIAFLIILGIFLRRLSITSVINKLVKRQITFGFGFVGLGAVGFLLAIGDYGILTPYHILREFPAFSQTRVSSRWLVLTMFSMLILFAVWKPRQKLINILLAVAVLELFLSFGPPRITGSGIIALPSAQFAPTYQTYDNGMLHGDFSRNPETSYYLSTRRNIGQIYSDDSIVNTLNRVIGTSKCGYNVDPTCDLVLSDNADIIMWTPNKIDLRRTGPGDIVLNMNIDAGWRINGSYPFASQKLLDPVMPFVIGPGDTRDYRLIYAPKLSPSWLVWRLRQ